MMVTNCPAIVFTLRVSAKAHFLNKRYSEHLETNEHKSVEYLREDISCGMRLQHKRNRQHKYLQASVDVKNPQANFDDLENSVPPDESNDELLDQAWDDHTGESLDAKKVKEARQLEMEYYDKMHVFDKMPIAQCWERTGKAPLKARWVDIDKSTRYRSRWVAKTVQRIRQRRTVRCNCANRGTASTDFTHHEWSQKERIDGVRRLSSLLLRSSATRDTRGAVRGGEEDSRGHQHVRKATHEHVWDQGRRSKLAKESPRNDGHTRLVLIS